MEQKPDIKKELSPEEREKLEVELNGMNSQMAHWLAGLIQRVVLSDQYRLDPDVKTYLGYICDDFRKRDDVCKKLGKEIYSDTFTEELRRRL